MKNTTIERLKASKAEYDKEMDEHAAMVQEAGSKPAANGRKRARPTRS